jgi:hypothetical protein
MNAGQHRAIGSKEYDTSLQLLELIMWFNSQCNFLKQKFDGTKVSHPSIKNYGSRSDMHVQPVLVLFLKFSKPCYCTSIAIQDMEHLSPE